MTSVATPVPTPAAAAAGRRSSSAGRRASPGCCSLPVARGRRVRRDLPARQDRLPELHRPGVPRGSSRRSGSGSRTTASSGTTRLPRRGLDDGQVHADHRRVRVRARPGHRARRQLELQGARRHARGHARPVGDPDRGRRTDVEVDARRHVRRRQRRRRRGCTSSRIRTPGSPTRAPRSRAVCAVDIWKTTPFVALLLLAGLQVIPSDLYEAADVDGASQLQQFWKITLPLLRAGDPRHADLPHARRAARVRRLLRLLRQPAGHADDGDLRPETRSSATATSGTAPRSASRSS